ncbi:MAG: hypothetical protein ACREPK_08215 [Rhodanobacteraceae bacterium]
MSTVKKQTINELHSNHDVESRAQAVFKSACENADSYHTLRLGLARRKAMNAGAAHFAVRIWAPLAGAACCALVAGVLWMRPAARVAPTANIVASSTAIVSSQAASEDITLELGDSQTEMVQDLDFYRWLATQPVVASTLPGSRR